MSPILYWSTFTRMMPISEQSKQNINTETVSHHNNNFSQYTTQHVLHFHQIPFLIQKIYSQTHTINQLIRHENNYRLVAEAAALLSFFLSLDITDSHPKVILIIKWPPTHFRIWHDRRDFRVHISSKTCFLRHTDIHVPLCFETLPHE